MARGGAGSPAFILWNHAISDKISELVSPGCKTSSFPNTPGANQTFLVFITKDSGWKKH